MDGNDKLKPYGISIHGCIDGYSRKVLWLQVMIMFKQSWPSRVVFVCHLFCLRIMITVNKPNAKENFENVSHVMIKFIAIKLE